LLVVTNHKGERDMKINTKLKAGLPRSGCGTPPPRPLPIEV
jgi:hypothetical protein